MSISLSGTPATAPASAPTGAGCDRACLVALADQFVAALIARNPSTVPLAPNVTFTENGARLTLGEGLWTIPTTLVTRRDVFSDPASGQVVFWGVLDERGAPVLLSARLGVHDRRVAEIELVVARKSSHALFAPDAFATLPRADQPVLRPDQRSTREKMVALADGYFEGFAQHDSRLVGSAIGCNRFENGVRMTNRPGAAPTPRACATAVDRLTHIKAVPERRYPVVDEARGVVVFDIPADSGAAPPREARMLLLAELLTIAGGEIQQIDTVMHNLPYGATSGWNVR